MCEKQPNLAVRLMDNNYPQGICLQVLERCTCESVNSVVYLMWHQ